MRCGVALLKWGLVASWANDPARGPKPINARAESVDHKFGEQFRDKRCLILTDGFYEWALIGGKKRANLFTLADGTPFAFAGLWDTWRADGQRPLVTICMVTTTANDVVRPVHDRMPVILPTECYAEWLDPATPVKRLLVLLKPYPAELMTAREVGSAVNSPRNDGPECLSVAS